MAHSIRKKLNEDCGDARLDDPVTLAQMRIMVDRAERHSGLTAAEAIRFRRGLDGVEQERAEHAKSSARRQELSRLMSEIRDMLRYWDRRDNTTYWEVRTSLWNVMATAFGRPQPADPEQDTSA